MITPLHYPFPEEVLCEIFLKLDKKSRLHAAAVCQLWYKIFTDPQFLSILITSKCGQVGFSQLEFYSKKEKLPLRQVFEYQKVIQFLNRDNAFKIVNEICSNMHIPIQGQYNHDCCNGWQWFYIKDDGIGCINLINSAFSTIKHFKHEEGATLKRIVCGDDSLFAIYSKGQIFHWDTHSQKEIQMLQSPFLRELEDISSCAFYVLNNRLVIHFVYDGYFVIEGIPYDFKSSPFSFEIKKKPGQKIDKIIAIDGHYVYFRLTDTQFSEILAYDLQEQRCVRTEISMFANTHQDGTVWCKSDFILDGQNLFIFKDFKMLIYKKDAVNWNLQTTIPTVVSSNFLADKNYLIYYGSNKFFHAWSLKFNQLVYSSTRQEGLTADLISSLNSKKRIETAALSALSDKEKASSPLSSPKKRRRFPWFFK